MNRRSFLQAAALASLPLPSLANNYPSRPINFIIPSTPGGLIDTMTRALIPDMQTELGQPIVPDNKPGAQQMIGSTAAARAAADGYTIALLTSGVLSINPHLMPNVQFDPRTAFTPLSLLAKSSALVIVNANSPIDSFETLLDRMKKGERLTYATGGIGISPHLTGELLRQRLNLNIEHVPFNGNPAAINATLGNHVDFLIDFVSTSGQLVSSGDLRALAVTTLSRVDVLPNIPTIAEFVPDFEVAGWMTVCAPAGTPAHIVTKLTNAIHHSLDTKEVSSFLSSNALIKSSSTPEEAQKFILSEYNRWGEIIKRAKISYS